MQNFYEPFKKRKKFNYQSGDVFGRLTYTGHTYTKIIYGHWVRYIEAVCICGVVKEYKFSSIACGDTQSCGCYKKDATSKRMKTHGLTDHPLYDVYKKIISRCYDENDKAFKNYGARNIEVWKDWVDDFMCFYNWCIENGWKEGLSVERIDNDGNYAPYNCKLATSGEQSRNRRNTRNFTAFGETKCLFDWGKDSRCVVSQWTLRGRMDKPEWEGRFEEALTSKGDRLKEGRNKKNNIYLTAFDETKCMSAWVEDERCVVAMDRLRDRIAEGWKHLEAITTVHKDKGDVNLTAFGETKSLAKWLRDERCVVKIDAVRDRLRKGWDHEDCLTVPSRTGTRFTITRTVNALARE